MARSAAPLVCGLGAALAAALAACSPFGGGAFECTLDTQCGAGGRCSSGYCSFPDGDCASGFRYGELSGPSSGQCVGGDMQMIDASMETDDTLPPDTTTGVCYGAGLVRACFATAPTGDISLATNINTDTSDQCDDDPRNAAWCVIAGSSVTVAVATVRATGSRPLVLVATNSIVVQGTLDASSRRVGGLVGAAANPSTCDSGTAPGASGGGAGGSFGGTGGAGGGGNSNATGGAAGSASASPTTLRGGCRGQDGNGANEGAGGNGGGAVYLIAETSINVSGIVNASGAGAASGASNASGAGGGGSGGFIGLDSPSVTVSGAVFANGGGGGEGSGMSTAGDPGDDPAIATIAAPGGSGLSSSGGDGGDGAAGTTLIGEAGTTGSNGGGGAGGGAGIIQVDRASSISGAGTVSPPAT